jgi:integrase/recombinase XerC
MKHLKPKNAPKKRPRAGTKPAGSTSTALAPLAPPVASVPALALAAVDEVLAAFLEGRNENTLRAYDRDLLDFTRFVAASDEPDSAIREEILNRPLEAFDARPAVGRLLSLSHGDANLVVLKYKAHLNERLLKKSAEDDLDPDPAPTPVPGVKKSAEDDRRNKLKPATIARRLAALRSVVKMARMIGRVSWTLDVESPKVKPYRDTRGPDDDGWEAMLAEAERAAADDRRDKRRNKPIRDLAILRLLHDLGLRRGELVGLDLADVKQGGRTIAVVGKGESDPVSLTLPDETRAALAKWIERRGNVSGPLFTRRGKATVRADRLTGTAVFLIVRDLGRKAGLSEDTRPHGLRHSAITCALEQNNGNIRDVARFSRHADLRTVARYDDNRQDIAGRVARGVAKGRQAKPPLAP